jgi:RNA polymerase sigma factor (TIGR02999 family)
MMDTSSASQSRPDAGGLIADCYAEIRRIARRLVKDRALAVLQPTELVHEAVLRMLRIEALQVEDRGHMLALAARIMRQALIDEVRKVSASKRQAPPLLTMWPERAEVLVPLDVLDAALEELVKVSADHAEIVELRFTLGMTVDEVAEATGKSPRTIKRRWHAARAWLQRYLEQND